MSQPVVPQPETAGEAPPSGTPTTVPGAPASAPSEAGAEAPGVPVPVQPPEAPAPVLVVCSRCRSENEPGSRFCYRCGFALDGAPVRAAVARTELEPGGFWARFGAILIDIFLVGLVQIIPAAVIFGDSSPEAQLSDNVTSLIALSILSAPALYHTVTIAAWGTTAGKRVFGLRVVTVDGRHPGIFRAFFRWLVFALSIVIFFPVVLVVVFDGRRRGLHDLICETRVVRR